MNDFTEKSGECKNCKVNRKWILHRQIFNNGSENFLWVCANCNKRNPDSGFQFYIPSELVRQNLSSEAMDALPTFMPAAYCRCQRCGNREAELHHWAPKAIFGKSEAERWPCDYLCKDCHDQWHRLVTPQIVQP